MKRTLPTTRPPSMSLLPVFFLLALLGLSLRPAHAQSTDMQLVVTQNDGAVGGTFAIQLQIQQTGLTAASNPSHTLCAFTADVTYDPTSLSYTTFSSDLFGEGYTVVGANNVDDPSNPFVRTGAVCSSVGPPSPFDGVNVPASFSGAINFITLTFEILATGGPAALDFRPATLASSYTNTEGTAADGVANAPVTSAQGANTAPLPVELVAFEAVRDGEAVVLRWQTVSETNNAGFFVERGVESADREAESEARAWEQVAFVEGRGTTAEAQAYTYRVEDLAVGRHVFRLKQIDFDGAFEYSPEVEVAIEMAERFALSPAYPNPFNPQTVFTLAVREAQEVAVEVFNMLGQRVAVLHAGPLAANESHRFVFEAGGLGSGLYLIRARGETFTTTRQVTLLK